VVFKGQTYVEEDILTSEDAVTGDQMK